ncbi:hypothetical protein J7E93_21195 [Streptomyces sp. ISL-36]|uniref:hypothetical protein n=1 Tax=Streptomyces sp. ISL-36 TaxID=2819182 RepID=UPI001BE5C27F|nr:hypothetical protein [Streptomyces sp. ISL-36]MBT2442575.1 hypothetical protein [Streptomyces sp. ISL-36]
MAGGEVSQHDVQRGSVQGQLAIGPGAYLAHLADPQVEPLLGHRLLDGAHESSVRGDGAVPLDEADYRLRAAGQDRPGPVAQDGRHPGRDVDVGEAVLPGEVGEGRRPEQCPVEDGHLGAAHLAAEVELQELVRRVVVVDVRAAQLVRAARAGSAEQGRVARIEPDLRRVPLHVTVEESLRKGDEEIEEPLQVLGQGVEFRAVREPGAGQQMGAPGLGEGRRELGPRDRVARPAVPAQALVHVHPAQLAHLPRLDSVKESRTEVSRPRVGAPSGGNAPRTVQPVRVAGWLVRVAVRAACPCPAARRHGGCRHPLAAPPVAANVDI